ncbi:hypothetical protein AAMO2058_001490500 [Amorphochlora amoebiformis]
MQGCHFCLCSDRPPPSRNDSPCTMLVLFLLQKGFKFISRLDGGYAACHNVIAQRGRRRRKRTQSQTEGDPFEMLVDHDPQRCVECLRNRNSQGAKNSATRGPGADGGRRLFGMLQTRLTDMLFGPSPLPMTEALNLESPQTRSKTVSNTSLSSSTASKTPRKVYADSRARRAFYSGVRSGRITILSGNSKTTPGISVLLTTLRETKTWNPCLGAALDRTTARLVDAAMDQAQGLEALWDSATRQVVVGAILRSKDARLFETALEPYGRVVRGQLARYRPGGSVAREGRMEGRWESGEGKKDGGFGDTLPVKFGSGSDVSLVLLFSPNGAESTDLQHSIVDLEARGAKICLLTFTIPKLTAGRLMVITILILISNLNLKLVEIYSLGTRG